MIDPALIQTIAVDLAGGAGSTEVKAAVAGHRWAVVSACLTTGATASSFIVLSAATALTGTVPIVANAIFPIGDGDNVVFLARNTGEALNIDPGAGDIDGWVNVVMLK